jgi:hypothetical protein
MKKVLIFIFTVVLTGTISGQTNEFSEHLSSGLFSFAGSSATKTSTLYLGGPSTMNPYGRKSSFSYVLGLQVQRITKSNFVFGLQTSYESLSSKVKVDYAEYNSYSLGFNVSGGKTILTNQFLCFHPFLGKRIKLINWMTSDLTLGTDLSICLNNREHETGIMDNGIKYDYFYSWPNNPTLDIRPRIDFTNYYKKFGLTIGYSLGLSNYEKTDESNTDMKVFSRMLRFGLIYRF